MDPQACLILAQAYIADGEPERAIAQVTDYHEWRTRGGLEPSVDMPVTGTNPPVMGTFAGDCAASRILDEAVKLHAAQRVQRRAMLANRKPRQRVQLEPNESFELDPIV